MTSKTLRDSVSTAQGRLLEAAERLFAERGFSATSVRDITTRAGCNVAAVNYHFGGKDALYLEVFQQRLSALRRARLDSLERVGRQPAADLEAVLRAFVVSFLEPMSETNGGRRLVALFVREMEDPHLPGGMLFEEMIGPVHEAFARALCAAAPGLADADVPACIQSVVGQALHFAHHSGLAGPTYCRMIDMSAEQIVEHVVRFSAGAIRALAADRS